LITKPKDVDESTDTYDTVDWLVKNVQNNNGKVGQYGTSYPGFYTAAGTLANHPALVASSPQAPISDFWFDDFHHNGAFLMSYFKTFPVFGVQKTKPEKESWFADKMIKPTDDGYLFYKNMGTLKKVLINITKTTSLCRKLSITQTMMTSGKKRSFTSPQEHQSCCNDSWWLV
jgi:predicted acyl esterase